jgi:hypothetical protein
LFSEKKHRVFVSGSAVWPGIENTRARTLSAMTPFWFMWAATGLREWTEHPGKKKTV